MSITTTLCVFAKPARPRQAKTRLIPGHGETRAAALARAFFLDTWTSVSGVSWAQAIVATTDPGASDWRGIAPSSVWPQGEGDLGERIERVMQRALARTDLAIAIGADTPGLPLRFLCQARDALATADAVLGPSDDGGFYLLGLRRCPTGLLLDLPWSAPHTMVATRERLRARKLSVSTVDSWFDVDHSQDLLRLQDLLSRGVIVAPETSQMMQRIGRGDETREEPA